MEIGGSGEIKEGREGKERKKGNKEGGAYFTSIDAFRYYPCPRGLCSFDQPLAEDLFNLGGHLKALDAPMDGDHQLWQFHLPLFQH